MVTNEDEDAEIIEDEQKTECTRCGLNVFKTDHHTCYEPLANDELCIHTWHPNEVRGKTADVLWVSPQLEEYTPMLCNKVDEILGDGDIPPGPSHAPCPPFLSVCREPTRPDLGQASYARRPLLQRTEEVIDEAFIAHDGEYTP